MSDGLEELVRKSILSGAHMYMLRFDNGRNICWEDVHEDPYPIHLTGPGRNRDFVFASVKECVFVADMLDEEFLSSGVEPRGLDVFAFDAATKEVWRCPIERLRQMGIGDG